MCVSVCVCECMSACVCVCVCECVRVTVARTLPFSLGPPNFIKRKQNNVAHFST